MPLDALNLLAGPAGALREIYAGLPREVITGTGASPRGMYRVVWEEVQAAAPSIT